MASARFGDQNELAGSVEKHGHIKSKKVANAKVTTKTTRPPAIGGHMHLSMKSNQRKEIHSRVSTHYPGWGKTVHGFEGKCSS
jgi:hypothetical protein